MKENQIDKQAIEEMAKDIKEILGRNLDKTNLYHWVTKDLYNIGYRKQSEWISVKERLPEETCRCLIVDKIGTIYFSCYSVRYGAFNATDEDEGDFYKMDNVSHWMPLPKPPKMKGGA